MVDRKELIGASEVSSVLGINPFCSPLKLYSLKTGELPQEEENEAMEWGKRLERVVSAKFSEAHGVKLMAYKKRYVHPTMPFFSCELDNIIVGTDELVEIKTVNAFQWKQWADPDEIPNYIIYQVTAQMGLSGRKKTWVACLCGGQKYIERCIEFDAELFAMIEGRVAEFWQMVQNRTPPVAVGEDNEILVDLFPESGEKILEASEDVNSAVGLLQQTKAQIIELEKTKDEISSKLKQVIQDNAGIRTPEFTVTWKTQSRAVIDTDALKLDGLYEAYAKESKTRVLRVQKNKGGKNG